MKMLPGFNLYCRHFMPYPSFVFPSPLCSYSFHGVSSHTQITLFNVLGRLWFLQSSSGASKVNAVRARLLLFLWIVSCCQYLRLNECVCIPCGDLLVILVVFSVNAKNSESNKIIFEITKNRKKKAITIRLERVNDLLLV